tara:strand:+ start:602 stop:889 length:288 start_codon:yes stop_codon:yes gene_type:complete
MISSKKFWRTPKGYSALALIAAVTYFLLMEHRTHLFYALPFLILLLCPMMHMFMHGGHGDTSHDHSDIPDSEASRKGVEDGRRQTLDNMPSEKGR